MQDVTDEQDVITAVFIVQHLEYSVLYTREGCGLSGLLLLLKCALDTCNVETPKCLETLLSGLQM